MKVTLAFALVAVCIAESYTAAVPQKAVDWIAVEISIHDLAYSVRYAVQQTKVIAVEDDEVVGSLIKDPVNAVGLQVLNVLQETLMIWMDEYRLTEAKAHELLDGLKPLFYNLQLDLEDELALLSTGAATRIRDMFSYAYVSIDGRTLEIYSQLRAGQ